MNEKFQRGFIVLSRDLMDSSLWNLPPDHFRVATYLLLKARHNHKKITLLDGTEIGRGELVTSMHHIAENCSYHENRKRHEWSRQKVSRILESLESIGFLKHKSDMHGTHITICNYDCYQNVGNYNSDAHGTVATYHQPTPNLPPTTNNNAKNDNNGKNDIPPKSPKGDVYTEDFEKFWKAYRVGGKAGAFSAWKKNKAILPPVEDLIKKVEQYKAYCTSMERSFKDGQGWINQKFFETEWTHEAQGTRPKVISEIKTQYDALKGYEL